MGNELSATQNWEVTKKQARAYLMSGYLRDEFTKGVSEQEALAKVVTIISMGDELGIGRMQALRSINVIQGKPALSSELMLALCFKKIPGFKASFTTPPEKSHEECTIVVQRPGGDPSTFRFTMEEAKTAGIVKPGGGWQKYAPDMLRARVISRACRAVAPDATMGVASIEEMGGSVVDGEIVAAPADRPAAGETEKRAIQSPAQTVFRERTGNTPSYDERHRRNMEECCTPAQQKKLYAMTSAIGWTHNDAKDWLVDNFHVESSSELTKQDMQRAFDLLDLEVKTFNELRAEAEASESSVAER